jgi:curved DNA-binding protein CbpA
MHTHYDNLKVMRDAPDEVIRAAYKTLTQKYHPDRNPGDANAAVIMTHINASYAVLSDPVKRRIHDMNILRIEREERLDREDKVQQARSGTNTANPTSRAQQNNSNHLNWGDRARVSYHQARLGLLSFLRQLFARFAGLLIVIGILVGMSFFSSKQSTNDYPATPLPQHYIATPPAEPTANIAPLQQPEQSIKPIDRPTYIRPLLTPFGRPWPVASGYLSGAPAKRVVGLSEVTIDNSQNDSDVFVKLVYVGVDMAYPIRQFFIPGHSSFTVRHVQVGRYDIRYRDLSSGQLSRSESFDLDERRVENGTEYSRYELTLFKVAHGNMHTYDLAETDF